MSAMLRMNFTAPDYLKDPTAKLAELRAAGPLVEVRFPIIGRTWITTTHEMTSRVLKDNNTFTMRKDGALAGLRWWMPASVRALAVSMLSMDEPDHSRLRGIVDEAFRRCAILDMEPRIASLAEALAAELFADGSPADLVERYARKLPLSVICELPVCPPPIGRASLPGPIRSPVSRA
jgi:cytochrome P450 PksS